MPIQAPTTTPTVVTPGTSPQPFQETYTSPEETCPQQHRELASPDIEP